MNPFQSYFDAHTEGRGIWKWEHYFPVYHRHFEKFRGKEVHICEIGVYSGGSLEMWREYFGPGCHVYGVDIRPECKAYESDWCRIFVGDQGDRNFWREFKQSVPILDILIDDGSHKPEDQQATLEVMLPHIQPGGVYLCEDIHGADNPFGAYLSRMAIQINGWENCYSPAVLAFGATSLQKLIHSIHLYPFLAVIERREEAIDRFTAPRHGTEWQPFPV